MTYRPIRFLFALLAPARLLTPLSIAALLAALVVGCATFQNTPKQEYVLTCAEACKAQVPPQCRITRVDTDGRISARCTGTLAQWDKDFNGCMREQFKAHPYADWVKARQASAQPTSAGTAAATGAPAVTTLALAGSVALPVWHVGDEWQYAYQGPTGSGTFVWVVNRIETLNGEPNYVLTFGTREIFHRVSDLANALERVNGMVVLRETPPRLIYAWPLTVGKTWEETHTQERPMERFTTDRTSVWTVVAEDTVTVPAGTFRTLKITWRNKNTGNMVTEMWYAPEVKQWVKIREVLTNGIREREMVSFNLK